MTLEISNFQLDKVCRTCLCEGDVESIYTKSKVDDISLVELLNIFASIEFNENNKLPSQICVKCTNEIQRFHKFKQQCQKSDETLKCYVDLLDASVTIESVQIKCELINEEKVKKTRRQQTKTKKFDSDNEITYSNDVSWQQENTSSDKTEFRIKKRDATSKGPPYVCKRCDIKFESIKALSQHRAQVKHPRNRNHACAICGKSFTHSQLCAHMRTHTHEKPYSCEVCDKRFTLKCNLSRHVKIHTGVRPHKCHLCGKAFIQSTTLTEHLRLHSGETPFVCNKCGRCFIRSGRLRQHLLRHRYEENGEQQIYEHQCEICDKSFYTNSILKTHRLSHGDKSYLCSHCGSGFVSMAGLQSHEKTHTGRKPYPCPVCGKSFAQLSSMKSHHLVHTGQRPFACSVCERTFTQAAHLMYHKRTHTGERPYPCSVCDKRFTLRGTLTVHMRTHTGETPYLCPVCNKGFYDSSSMNKHRRRHGCAPELSK